MSKIKVKGADSPDKPVESKSDDRLSRIKAFVTQANKKYGDGFLGMASGQLQKMIPRIPAGIFSLDAAMGGGVPVGRMTMFYGDKSSGKTTIAKRVVGIAQKICSNCYRPAIIDGDKYSCDCEKGYRGFIIAWMDVEGAFDRSWAEVQGVNMDTLLYSRPDFAEQCIDTVDAWLRTGDVDMIVIDSLAQLVPTVEVEKSVVDEQMGVSAKLLNKATRKWGGALNYSGRQFGRRPTVVLIQQLRQKLGIMFGSPDVVPGGKGQGFVTSIEVKLWSGPVELEEKTNRPLWEVKRFKVTKNKVSPAHKSGEFMMVLSTLESGKKIGDLMEEEIVFDVMESIGIVQYEKEGGRIILLDEQRLNGKGQVVKYWIDNPERFKQYKEAVKEEWMKRL